MLVARPNELEVASHVEAIAARESRPSRAPPRPRSRTRGKPSCTRARRSPAPPPPRSLRSGSPLVRCPAPRPACSRCPTSRSSPSPRRAPSCPVPQPGPASPVLPHRSRWRRCSGTPSPSRARARASASSARPGRAPRSRRRPLTFPLPPPALPLPLPLPFRPAPSCPCPSWPCPSCPCPVPFLPLPLPLLPLTALPLAAPPLPALSARLHLEAPQPRHLPLPPCPCCRSISRSSWSFCRSCSFSSCDISCCCIRLMSSALLSRSCAESPRSFIRSSAAWESSRSSRSSWRPVASDCCVSRSRRSSSRSRFWRRLRSASFGARVRLLVAAREEILT